ncbi:MAG: hypothetical protein ACFE91_11820 [Promethearchaeota archaeon]
MRLVGQESPFPYLGNLSKFFIIWVNLLNFRKSDNFVTMAKFNVKNERVFSRIKSVGRNCVILSCLTNHFIVVGQIFINVEVNLDLNKEVRKDKNLLEYFKGFD